MAKEFAGGAKWLRNLQQNIRISNILQTYGFNYEKYVRKIKINLLELCKC
jgi:hypothetical protein